MWSMGMKKKCIGFDEDGNPCKFDALEYSNYCRHHGKRHIKIKKKTAKKK